MKKIFITIGIIATVFVLNVSTAFCAIMIADPGDGGGGGDPMAGYIIVQDSRDNHLISGATVELFDVAGRRILSAVTDLEGKVTFYNSGGFGYRVAHPSYHTLTGFQSFLVGSTVTLTLNPNCGDGLCDTAIGESVANCALDCAVCGDGVCSTLENSTNCPQDCAPSDPCAGVNCDAYDYNSSQCGAQAINQCCTRCYNIAGAYSGCTTWRGSNRILAQCR